MQGTFRVFVASSIAVLAWDCLLSLSVKSYIRTLAELAYNALIQQLPFHISSVWQLAVPLLFVTFFPRVSMIFIIPYLGHLYYGWFAQNRSESFSDLT